MKKTKERGSQKELARVQNKAIIGQREEMKMTEVTNSTEQTNYLSRQA